MANEQYKIQLVIEGDDKASTKLSGVNKELDQMDKGVKQTSSSWSSFKGGVESALGAFAIAGGFAVVVNQVNELGTAVNAAEKTFTQVTGGVDEATASLARMRQATGGVIDDMTLMKGASSLLVTGIASTNEQAEELVNLGSRLSAVMGVDAAEGIGNLNSALLNNSFMRLDTLGISAAAVRERVNELKEAGMDMSEAFSQAVLEIGTKTLEDLGDAAAVSETAIARLTTQFTNMGQALAGWVNVQLETAATSLEQLLILGDLAMGGTGGLPQLEAEKAQYEQLMAMAEQYRTMQLQSASTSGAPAVASGTSLQDVQNFMESQAALVSTFQSDISSGTFFQDAFSSFDPAKIDEARMAITALRPELAGLSDAQLLLYAKDLDISFQSLARASEAMEVQTLETNTALETQATTMAYANELSALEDRDAALTRSAETMSEITAQNQALQDSLSEGAMTSASGMAFFDPQQLSQVQSQTEAIVAEYERLKALGESSEFTLVSELEVERAREIAESAQETAEQSERNAAAWEKASLAMIAGATGGGRENEFNQQVLAGIEDPEQRAALERQMNLNSGVENANTDVLAYGQDLVTQIVDEKGIAAGAEASEAFVKAFEDGLMAGLSGEDLKTYIEGEVGYALSGEAGSSGAEIEVQPGEGYIALAQRTGYTREELEAANGGEMLMAGQIITLPDGSALIAIGENTTPEEAANNILTQAGTSVAGTDTPYTYTPAMSPYTTYDPATGGYIPAPTEVGVASESSLTSPETAETVSMMADDFLAMEMSVNAITQADASLTLDPLVSDVETANLELTSFEEGLTALVAADWLLELPISFVFDTQTAELLSRNSQVVEVFKLVLPMLGITPNG